MKLRSIAVVFLIGFLTIYFHHSVQTKLPQPHAGYTGAPGDLGACGPCHSGGSIPGALSINFSAGGSNYTLSDTFNLIVSISAGAAVYGFQMVALDDQGNSVGSFINNNSLTATQFSSGRDYINNSGGSGNPAWAMKWEAPSTDVGNVTFFISGIAGNANLLETGDDTYNSNLIINPPPPSAAINSNVTSVCPGDSIQFFDVSSGTVTQ